MGKYDFDFTVKENDSLSLISTYIKPSSKILEFGPASGRFTNYLSNQLGCQVHIVEIMPDDFKTAMQYAKDGLCSDVETGQWKEYFKGNKYDHIIFADVLEHLRFPEKVFKDSVEYLKDDGSILFSIPNTAHSDLIYKLYYNSFDYTDIGLLDDTHAHLFAYNNMIQMINDASLVLTNLKYTIYDLGWTEQHPVYNNPVLYELLVEKEYGTVYQFIGECKKSGKGVLPEDYKIIVPSKCSVVYSDNKDFNNIISEYEIEYNIDNKHINFTLENIPANVEYIRLKLHNNMYIQLLNVDISKEAEYIIDNAFIKEDGKEVLFYSKQPCIDIHIKEQNCSKISISFELAVFYTHDMYTYMESLLNNFNYAFSLLRDANTKLNESYNALNNDFHKAHDELYRVNNELHKAHDELTMVHNELYTAHNELNIVYGSLSWKITKPLRKLKNILKGRQR